MAVNLLGAGDARIDYGDLVRFDGKAELAIALTLRLNSAAVAGRYLVSKFGTGAVNQTFLFTVPGADVDEVGFAMSDSSGRTFGKKTTDLNLASGNLYRMIAKLDPSASAGAIWVNGVSRTVAAYLGSDTGTVLTDGNATLQIGRNTINLTDGEDGDYAEVAIWGEYVPDWFCSAYGKGYAPTFYRPNLLFYVPLFNASHLLDVQGAAAGTNTAGTNATHPSMVYPRSAL